jgi:nucleotide-binding universal stress UspA family protein
MNVEVSSVSDSFGSDSLGFVIAIGASWLAIGVALAIVMGRRGHNGFGWLVMGAIMGPLAVAFAIDAGRHDEQLHPEPLTPRRSQERPRGPVNVLVGYDGSPEAIAALEAATVLLGTRAGRVTVATVVPYGDVGGLEDVAREQLRHLGQRQPEGRDFEILHGHPSAALAQRAAQGGYDLIVIGTRGEGVSKAILGSAATELARKSKVPVLLAGVQGHRTTEAA